MSHLYRHKSTNGMYTGRYAQQGLIEGGYANRYKYRLYAWVPPQSGVYTGKSRYSYYIRGVYRENSATTGVYTGENGG